MEHKKGSLLSELLGIESTPLADWEKVKQFLANRYNIKATNINAMAQYMAVELGFADKSVLGNRKKVGAPSKWFISIDGLRLYARLELEKLQNPRVKKLTIAQNVKDKYGYPMSAKTLLNLYNNLPLDPFVRNVLEGVHYSTMSRAQKLAFLQAHSRPLPTE